MASQLGPASSGPAVCAGAISAAPFAVELSTGKSPPKGVPFSAFGDDPAGRKGLTSVLRS